MQNLSNTITSYSACVVCSHNRPLMQSTFFFMSNSATCALIYTKGLPETPIHVQAFPRMAGLIAVPLTLTQSHTQMHTHICACVDHLLTMLCNNSTCLGLRLLFPSKKLTMSGLDSWPPFFVVFFCPHSLPTSVWGLA